jgi:hypothetical protein
MNEPAYPPARAVARTVETHLARQAAAARERGEAGVAPAPDASTIEAIIETAFWASLRREEGYTPTISMVYLAPDAARGPLIFEPSVPLEADALTRLAAAVKHPGIHLGVCRGHDELCVWGTTRTLPPLSFVLEVIAPGLLVVKYPHGESGKFVNVAVLEGDQIKIIDEHGASLPDCPEVVTALLGFESPASWMDSVNVFVRLAVSMRAHGRGGSLLVVPGGTDRWRESIVQPIRYAIVPPFSEIADLMAQGAGERAEREWQDALALAVDRIAGLTAVDGATVMSDRYEVLAFAAKIARHVESARVDQVIVTEPIERAAPATMHPSQLGGTRHLSAAQFVHDQRDAVALVASQDGRFTIFSWSPCEDMVHAHRVEALLL